MVYRRSLALLHRETVGATASLRVSSALFIRERVDVITPPPGRLRALSRIYSVGVTKPRHDICILIRRAIRCVSNRATESDARDRARGDVYLATMPRARIYRLAVYSDLLPASPSSPSLPSLPSLECVRAELSVVIECSIINSGGKE